MAAEPEIRRPSRDWLALPVMSPATRTPLAQRAFERVLGTEDFIQHLLFTVVPLC